jgi:cyclase
VQVLQVRVIPCLLLSDRRLVKTLRFGAPRYVGDPINAVRIFNEKEADELIFLDISATEARREPNFELVAEIASEAFMPFAYGGGIRTLQHAQRLFSLGVEKVVLNSAALERPELIGEIATLSGRQSVVLCIDVVRTFFGHYQVASDRGRRKTGLDPVTWARRGVHLGAGEVVVQSVDQDGTLGGYDLDLTARVARAVNVPVVALGGAKSLGNMKQAVEDGGAAAVAAGSYFVFHGKHQAVLITYPPRAELEAILGEGK